ncbi:MAG TPA: glycosyltransferase [Candidatus Polarisedimenticolia bacterium]|nr:glycosyltransferase [Candidatus Polarisedimenticolia bacterium]
MMPPLEAYGEAAGAEVIHHLRQVARPLKGARVVHVNSTATGGGVAEILSRLVPLKRELGIDASWEIVEGNPEFFSVTKRFHNGLQGAPVEINSKLLDAYLEVNRRNAERLAPKLKEADFVLIHDPQPAAFIRFFEGRKGKWIWRCHIDVSRPDRAIWKYLREFVRLYDASVFSLAAFAQPLGHPQYLIHPSIDPLSEKNMPLEPAEVALTAQKFKVDPERPMVLQVSRFDRFKDPVGVVRAYRLTRKHVPIQLVMAGGTADDDPEGEAVLAAVREEAGGDPDIHLLLLPSDAHRTINALQRRADIVLQKSIKEGFGLTVTEALWKERPVIGGETGGIVLQVVNGHTGFLVNTPEGAAFRIRYLLSRPRLRASMGLKGRRFVRENFLLTRHLREYLTMMLALRAGARDQIEIQ